MADRAYITPKVLKWGRESAKMSVEVAAAKVHVTPEKLNEWEEGLSQPTIKQAENLAKAYRRPFALFFLPEVPKDFHPLQDFRRKTSKQLGTASTFIIREIQQKQAWISNVYQDNREEPLAFVGKFSALDSPQVVAKDILSTLNINPAIYSTDNPIKEWIDKAEAKGIFISRTSFIHSRMLLDSDELQGFAISDVYAPFVFVNSDDWNAPQLFTIAHEIAHIWIGASGISNEVEPFAQHKHKLDPIELFCNEVAANSLMPLEIMKSLDKGIFDRSTEVFRISKKMGISTFAFLVRALNLNLISLEKYRNLKQAADVDFQAFLKREEQKKVLQKQKEGGPNPYLMRLNKNSRLFTQIVLDAFKGGFVEATVASNLLNTQTTKFTKFETWLYR